MIDLTGARTVADGGTASEPSAAYDSALNPALSAPHQRSTQRLSRWMGWRLRLVVALALLGCLGVFMLASKLAEAPRLAASWRATGLGQLELVKASDPALDAQRGKAVIALAIGNTTLQLPELSMLQHSARWLVDDAARERLRQLNERISKVLAQDKFELVFADGQRVASSAPPRGYASLPVLYWLLSAGALMLYLVGMVVLLARPSVKNLLYAVMTVCQAGNLLFMAAEATVEFAMTAAFMRLDMSMRMSFDLITAAAVVNAATLHPRRLPASRWIAAAAWLFALVLVVQTQIGTLVHLWWWTQGGVAALSLAALALFSWSYRIEPHPYAMVLRRFGIAAVLTWLLLSVAMAAAENEPATPSIVALTGPMVWFVFFASLLLLLPFQSKSHQVVREFSLLAVVSTVATSLDLLFVAAFSLSPFASLTLSLFIALGLYSGARQWILVQLRGASILTTERMFEQLYRIAREVEAHPERTALLLSQLLRELFEPIEVTQIDKSTPRARITGDGSTMLVPVPLLPSARDNGTVSLVIRFAHRGTRLFAMDDARLADRIVEQLQRAVAFDKAVEHGRTEERLRLAQDLHDDIGARLLTLMYKSPTPEMEEYVRHTLQDLKTLTRGLAAPNHPLSHASAEWKADLTQRLLAAHVDLGWECEYDEDILLSVVQWSALTRVLRELVSNAIAHAQASRVEIAFALERDRLDLTVCDNGVGRNPRVWAHGLGLGGVRKRVKQLSGEVEWREIAPHGIGCRVTIRHFSAPPA